MEKFRGDSSESRITSKDEPPSPSSKIIPDVVGVNYINSTSPSNVVFVKTSKDWMRIVMRLIVKSLETTRIVNPCKVSRPSPHSRVKFLKNISVFSIKITLLICTYYSCSIHVVIIFYNNTMLYCIKYGLDMCLF